MKKPIIFGGSMDDLPEYEIKVKVKLPGPDHWPKEQIANALDIVNDLTKKAALTSSVIAMATMGLSKDIEGIEQYTHLSTHLKMIDDALLEGFKCGCKVTRNSLLKNFASCPTEIKLLVKDTILRHLETDMSEEARAKIRKEFAEVLDYEEG